MRTRRHALGQNFLHHKPTIQKIADLVDSEITKVAGEGRKSKTLLEVGPGKLALTEALAPVAKKQNLPLILVERDRYLEETIQAGSFHQELHFMDAATEKFTELLDAIAAKNETPVFFASNLPYSAASQIIANLCERINLISGAVVMVQKEMALRMAAGPGGADRGAFSLLVQSYFEVKMSFDVAPGAFNPPPKVKSTVLTLKPLKTPATAGLPDPKKFETFCKQLFSQRRKMIRNLIPPAQHELFPKLSIDGTERPETLELETILELFKAVHLQAS